MKILISAGPTQEPIDEVRYITNASSGKMGAALVEAAVEKGHKVTLVLGPVTTKPKIKNVRVVDVRTAEEMTNTVLKELKKGFDVFISAAAVADYSPKKPSRGKIKSGEEIVLRLRPTKKITSQVKKKFSRVLVVAFKAEVNVSKKALVERAYSKLCDEKLDLIVANDVEKNRMGYMKTDAYIIDRNRNIHYLKSNKKSVIGKKIINFIESTLEAKFP